MSEQPSHYEPSKWYRFGWSPYSMTFYLRWLHYLSLRENVQSGDTVLELGSNFTLWKIYSNRVGPNGLFVAADIDLPIQRDAKRLSTLVDTLTRRHKKDTIVVADGVELPFVDNSFDLILASNFVGDPDYKQEAYRILKPGGKLLISWMEIAGTRAFNSREEARDCRKFGFENIRRHRGTPILFPPGFNYQVHAQKPL